MTPPPRVRLSTTTARRQRSVSLCATDLVMKSTPPPGEEPTSTRIGLDGYPAGRSSASVADDAKAVVAPITIAIASLALLLMAPFPWALRVMPRVLEEGGLNDTCCRARCLCRRG